MVHHPRFVSKHLDGIDRPINTVDDPFADERVRGNIGCFLNELNTETSHLWQLPARIMVDVSDDARCLSRWTRALHDLPER